MSLLDTIKAEAGPRRPACTIGRLVADLPAADVADLRVAFADEGLAATTIASALSKHVGRRVGADVVRRHRRGACGCGQ